MGQARKAVLPFGRKLKILERYHMKQQKEDSFHKCFRIKPEDQKKLTRVVKHLDKKYGISTEAGAFRFLINEYLESGWSK